MAFLNVGLIIPDYFSEYVNKNVMVVMTIHACY